jgi:hypothetical protein
LLLSAGLLAAALAIEGSCRVYLRLRPPANFIGRWEFRSQCPPPYQDADYYSPEFLSESMRCVSLWSPPGAGYLVHADFQGRHINVSSQRRHTTDTPAQPVNRVLLFGGSTVFCSEVPDEWTIASCLQRLLNERSGPPLAVENHGTCSMIARQQTERLLATPLRPGDVVIFYDGVNDVYYPIFNGNPRGWHPGESHDGGVRRLSRLQRKLYPLSLRYKDISATARLLLQRMDVCPPKTVTNRAMLSANLDAAETGYRQALSEAERAVTRQGGRFFHFLQPNIFTLPHPSHYERRTAENELKALPGLDLAFELGYPRLRQALAAAAEQGVVSFDIADALNERRPRQQYYLDFCHVNHAANERIANVIFAHVFGGH